MKKEIVIDGMSCAHCSKSVENALNGLAGVRAKVNLKKKTAVIDINDTVSDEALRETIDALGFTVVSIVDKKGLFGRG